MDDAVQGPAADLSQAAVRLNGPAPALLPAHEIQQQELAPVACGRGEWEGGDKGPPRRVLLESEPRAPGGAGVGGIRE